MRILWHSNAPNCATGYGVQTALVVPRLQGLGHDLAISASWGVRGGMMGWPGPRGTIPIYPGERNVHGLDVIGSHAIHHRAGMVITHYDAFMFDQQLLKQPWVPWFPCDTQEISPMVLKRVEGAGARYVQTLAGQASMAKSGVDSTYMPAAFDGDVYYPDSESVVREQLGISPETFMVGMVAANKGSQPCRKAFPQAFEGFSLFHAEHPESLLYVHSDPANPEGLDLVELAEHYGIADAIRFAHPYGMLIGYEPEQMRQLYNAFDVLLCPSMGEGVGVPIIESQACGTPVITGDWTSMPEVTRTGATISRDDAFRYHYPTYGDWYLADPRAIARLLADAVDWHHDPATTAERVQDYELNHVLETHWQPALAQLEEQLTTAAAAAAGPNRAERRRQMRMHDKAPA